MSREITDAIDEAYRRLRTVNKQGYNVNRKLREQNLVYEQLVSKIGVDNTNMIWSDLNNVQQLSG